MEKLCEKFGINITISYYGMIEQGVRTPNLELALAIADLFEKPVRKIFFEQINNEMLDDVVQGDNPDAHTQTG
ncbi:helix-turn-helix protein [Planifilum fimeticola]|uniref:Helix-turn-helix protein n=1 Tax=Planifilum fimeticola TaxID=201975 RepID=A0A2T0LFB1_9BACL|nr:helix-turn-helix protein [Planifilum fimeticola]